MYVKICGVTGVEDAQLVVDSGADAVGIIFASSPRQISLADAVEISSLIAQTTVDLVGVFAGSEGQQVEHIAQIAEEVGLDRIQLHNGTVVDHLQLSDLVPVWLSVANTDERLWQNPFELPVPVHVDAQSPGSGISYDYGRLGGLDYEIILAGGLSVDNIESAIARARPWGVDVVSRVEVEPGIKDPELVRQFVSKAKDNRLLQSGREVE